MYVVVGCFNLAMFQGAFFLGRHLMPYAAAHVLSYAITSVLGACTHARITYHVLLTVREAALLAVVFLLNAALSALLLVSLVESRNGATQLMSVVAAAATAPLGFVLSRRVLRRRR
ncbi:GtrA family protein [Streptomyces phaeochromogenes]